MAQCRTLFLCAGILFLGQETKLIELTAEELEEQPWLKGEFWPKTMRQPIENLLACNLTSQPVYVTDYEFDRSVVSPAHYEMYPDGSYGEYVEEMGGIWTETVPIHKALLPGITSQLFTRLSLLQHYPRPEHQHPFRFRGRIHIVTGEGFQVIPIELAFEPQVADVRDLEIRPGQDWVKQVWMDITSREIEEDELQ